MKIYCDISPLQEPNYTGIPSVAQALATKFLNENDFEVEFFWERLVIPRKAVEMLLELKDGRYFLELLRSGHHNLPLLDRMADKSDLIFFTNVGIGERITARQIQFIHDLTTIIIPEMHHQDTINWHKKDFSRVKTNIDFFIANSACTADDASIYLDIPKEKINICPLGINLPDLSALPVIHDQYLCVIGTLEPRKNIRLIFSLLEAFPTWLDLYRFVFIGRFGWGRPIEDELAEFPELHKFITNGRIIFTGYVSDNVKWSILASARASIYPSIYEGFGLPVLESLACGTPCAASYSSSLTEAGVGLASYFDPFDHRSLHLCLQTLLKSSTISGTERMALRKVASEYSWDRFYNSVKTSILEFAG